MQKSRWATKTEEEEAQMPTSTPVAAEEAATSAPATGPTSQPEPETTQSLHNNPVRTV
jgi:hypothetical protein